MDTTADSSNNSSTGRIDYVKYDERKMYLMRKMNIMMKGLPALGIISPGGNWEEAMEGNKKIILDNQHRLQLYQLLIRAARK